MSGKHQRKINPENSSLNPFSQDIRTFLAEDKKTVYLYEKWDSKEDHQAYLDFRVKDGLMDFLKPRLEGDFKVTYFSEE